MSGEAAAQTVAKLEMVFAKVHAALAPRGGLGLPAAAADISKLKVLGLDAAFRLAGLHLDKGRLEDARKLVSDALELDPTDPRIALRRAQIAEAAGEFVAAAEFYIHALADPAQARMLYDFAQRMVTRGERPVGRAAISAYLGLDPDHAGANRLMALICLEAGELSQAKAFLRHVLKSDPGDIGSLLNLFDICQYEGNIEESRLYIENALKCHPDNPEAHYFLSYLEDYRNGHWHVDHMLELYDRPDCDDHSRKLLGFALYKALDAAKDYRRAFACLAEGNRLQRQLLPYDRRLEEGRANAILAAFTRERVEVLEGSGPAGPSPIFILGMPRSGSTLTEQILASHPDVFGGGELDLSGRMVKANFMLERGGIFLPGLASMTRGRFAEAGARLAESYQTLSKGKPRIADKMPFNFFWLGYIRLMLPDAKFVHIRRAPAATMLANYAALFGTDSVRYLYDLEDIAAYIVMQERIMAHWKALFPGAIYELSYEALTEDQEGETRRLLDFCGLDWNPACLDFHRTKRVVVTSSSSQVRKALYSGVDRKTANYLEELEPGLKILRAAGLVT